VLFEKNVFDKELLACIKKLQGFSDVDALIDSEDERWLARSVAWFTGVFRRAKEDRHALDASVDCIISATVDVLGGPFAISPDHAKSICGDPEVSDLIFGKGGPQAAALLATRYLARAVLPIRHKASERWLWLVLRRVRAQEHLRPILALIEERGYLAARTRPE